MVIFSNNKRKKAAESVWAIITIPEATIIRVNTECLLLP